MDILEASPRKMGEIACANGMEFYVNGEGLVIDVIEETMLCQTS